MGRDLVWSAHFAGVLIQKRETAKAAQAGGVDVLLDGWIHDAWTPQPPEPTKYIVGFGYYWEIRQDGG